MRTAVRSTRRSCLRRSTPPVRGAPSCSRCTDPERHPACSVPNDRVLAWAAQSEGRFVPFCRLDPADDPIAEGERCLAAGARGIKLHPRAQNFDFDGEALHALDAIFALAERESVPILIHAGRGLPPIADGLSDIALRHPGAVLILAHAAIADQATLTERLADHPGVLYDLSTWAAFDVFELYARVPAERIVFATDPPYGNTATGLYGTLRVARAVGLDDATTRLVLGGTMAALLDGDGLPAASAPRGEQVLRVHARLMRIYGYLLMAGPALFSGNPEIARGGLELARAVCRDRRPDALEEPLRRIGDALDAALVLLAEGSEGVRPTLDLVQRCLAMAVTEPASARPARGVRVPSGRAAAFMTAVVPRPRPATPPPTPPTRADSRSASPHRCANAVTTSSTSCTSRPLASSCEGAATSLPASSCSSGRRRFAAIVTGSTGAPRPGSRSARRSNRRASTTTSLTRALSRVATTLSCSWSRPTTGENPSRAPAIASTPEPQPTSSSGPVGEAAGGELEQQLQTQARRCVGAGSERLCRVDHDLLDGRAARRGRGHLGLPRRAHVQRGNPARGDRRQHEHRPVEGAPALRPVVGDLGRAHLDERVPGGSAHVGQGRDLSGRAVHRVLDHRPAVVDLLHAGGRELEQLSEHELGLLARDANAEADHAAWWRRARRSFANIDSSERRFSSVSDPPSSSSSSRWRADRRRGMTTLTTTFRSPGRPRRRSGMP